MSNNTSHIPWSTCYSQEGDILSKMYSHDINDSTCFTVVKINGSHTPCYHHLERSQKHLISNTQCRASSLLFTLSFPAAIHIITKKCSENERASSLTSLSIFSSVRKRKREFKKRPLPCRKCHSYEMNTGIFRGDSCPWQFSALQTAIHPAVGHSQCHHHETNRVPLCHSPCSIVIHWGSCPWFKSLKSVQFDC